MLVELAALDGISVSDVIRMQLHKTYRERKRAESV